MSPLPSSIMNCLKHWMRRAWFSKPPFNGRYMWPYDETATKSILYQYDSASSSLQVAAQDSTLCTLLGFSHPPSQQTMGPFETFERTNKLQANPVKTEKTQVVGRFYFEKEGFGENLDIVLCGSSEGMQSLLGTYAKNSSQLNRLYERTNQYYRELQDQKLSITSPDPIFNEGYRWALARTDQFFQTTPDIGTTHMAGFGTTARGWNGRHEVSGRPGYAWYFGRDGEWSGMAVNAYGDFDWVKEMLKVFERYQNLSGKIFHELTTSGAVHYDASDSTPLYVILAAHYLKYSNDQAFIEALWPSLQKAIDFCYTTDTDGDGLIENTNVGHGWIEGGALFDVHTELYLAGSWAACLDAGAYIADLLGKNELKEKYSQDAEKVKAIIDQNFWDTEEQYFYNAKYQDGSYQTEAAVLQAVPVYLNTVLDSSKARAAIAPFARRNMTTDWGIRMIAADNPKFNPVSYHSGMVWPLYGGWAALAEYETGHYNSGFFHFYANLINYLHWGKGSVEETLHGEFFQPAGVCSQQCWSETMVLLPIIEGMLGLRPDAPNGRLSLSPRFPIHWPTAEIKNIRMGKALLDLNWEKEKGLTTLQLERTDSDGPEMELSLRPALPLGSQIIDLTLNGQKHDFELIQGPEGVEVELAAFFIKADEDIIIKIVHSGGIGIAPLTIFPKEGAASEGARIVSQKMTDSGWQGRFDGLPGKKYVATVWSEEEVQGISGGIILEKDGPLYTIEFRGSAVVEVLL
jgi:glycogen debranching enzyme